MVQAVVSNTGGRDELAAIEAFLEKASDSTLQRIKDLGLNLDGLLDPEASIEEQVALLYFQFLEAERSCLPFNQSKDQFWKVLQARLQPIVLAYHGYAKYLSSLKPDSRELRQDRLLDMYRQRLANSERFRAMVFDLESRLKQQNKSQDANQNSSNLGGTASVTSLPVPPPEHRDKMSQNIMASLEKQLQTAEKLVAKQTGELQEYQNLTQKMQQSLDDAAARYDKLKQQYEELQNRASDAKSQGRVSQESGATDAALKIESLERELTSATDAAYNSYMMASDLGIVNRYLLGCQSINGIEQLALHLVKAITEFGLRSVVGLRLDQGYRYWPDDEAVAELASVLDQNTGATETIQQPHLMVFSADCCLLVENPPREDEERFKRLQGYFETALQLFQVRLDSRRKESSVQRQKKQVDALILRSDEALQDFDRNVQQQRENIASLLANVDADLLLSIEMAADDPRAPLLSQQLVLLEEKVLKCFSSDDLLDPTYRQSVAKVAQALRKKSVNNNKAV